MAVAGYTPASDSMRTPFKQPVLWMLLGALASCREQSVEPDTARLGTDFFPMETGLYWEYEVDLTTYNLLDSVSSHFFLREVVADSFGDLSGGISYKLERFVRETEEDEWERDSVWTARLNTYQAVRVENNVPYVKLSFPLREGKSWNGNVLNSRQEESYQARNLGAEIEAGDSLYSNTVTILQREVPDTIVFYDVRREYFARNTGLIKKEYIQLNYCTSQECFGQRQIDSGRKLLMELVANGKE